MSGAAVGGGNTTRRKIQIIGEGGDGIDARDCALPVRALFLDGLG